MPERIQTKIESDLAGAMAVLTGGVYTRPLQRLKTPSAFTPDKIHYNPAAYIPDIRVLAHPQSESIPLSYQGTSDIVLYAEAHSGGKAAVAHARQALIELLHDWVSDTDAGPKVFFRWGGGLPTVDSEEFLGAVVAVVTFNVTSRWANVT